MSRSILFLAILLAGAPCVMGCAFDVEDDGEDEDVAESADSLKAPRPDGFTFASSRDEREKAVPVTGGGNAWKTIYSVKLEDLTAGERIAVRGEVQLTRCHQSDVDKKTPCDRALPEGANLAYRAHIVIGGSQGDANGKRISKTARVSCTHFKHHCSVAIDEAIESDLSGTRFVKLLVAAEGSGKLMIVDEGKGGLAVTRMGRKADRAGKVFETRPTSGAWMDLDASDIREAKGLPGRRPHITFQTRIDNANPGDVLDVDARILAITASGGSRPGGCSGARDPLITHQVFASTGKNAEGSKIGTLTAKNGTNCRLDGRCTYEKSGALQVSRKHPAGQPLYVSVVSTGGRSCSGSGDKWRIDPASRMVLRRRR
jgi:hypothetical protein